MHKIAYAATFLFVAVLAIVSIFMVPNSTNLLSSDSYEVSMNPADTFLREAWKQAESDPNNKPEQLNTATLATGEGDSEPSKPQLTLAEAMQTLPDYGIGVIFDPDPTGTLAEDGYLLPKSNIDGYPIITDVTVNGTAHSQGIAKGTVITSIDGKPVAGLSLYQLADLIRASDATPIEITVLGDDEPVEVLRQHLGGE